MNPIALIRLLISIFCSLLSILLLLLLPAATALSQDLQQVVDISDSITYHLEQKEQVADSLLDSQLAPVTGIVQKADSLVLSKEALLQQKESQADSLLDPVESVVQKVDSVSQLLDADKQVNQKISQVENKVEDKVEDKINSIEKVGETKEALGNIESETGLNLDANAPGVPKLDMPDQTLGLPTDKLGQVKALPGKQLSRIKKIEPIEKAGKHFKKAGNLGKQASSYQEDVKALSKGNLKEVKQAPKALEQEALKTKELQELQKQSQSLEQFKQKPDQYKAEAEKYKSKDYLKQQATVKLKEKAVNHFAGRTDNLEAAQKKLGKLKRKYSEVQTEKGVYVKASSLKGEPFQKRLVLGSSLQIHQGPPAAFDLSPFTGFRFNKRWSAGLGGTYRIAFDKHKRISLDNPIYGGRLFTEALIHHKFLLHAEYEMLRAYVPPQILSNEQSSAWLNGVMLGAGKQYNITKKLKGNMMTLYNFTYHREGPYLQRWNVRFGFLFF